MPGISSSEFDLWDGKCITDLFEGPAGPGLKMGGRETRVRKFRGHPRGEGERERNNWGATCAQRAKSSCCFGPRACELAPPFESALQRRAL